MDIISHIIDEVIKSKSEQSDIIKDISSKVLNYNSNDFVMLMFDTKNISNNITLKYALKNVLAISKFIN